MADYATMSDADLLALVQPKSAGASVDYSKMSDAELMKMVQPQMGNAISDVVPEIKKAASENIEAIRGGLLNNPQKSAIGGLMDTGKGLLGIAGLVASPVTGAARSLIGHPLASATHAIGSVINPEIAAKDDPQQMYEHAKEGVDTAMMALAPRAASPAGMRPRGAPPTPSAGALKSDAVETFKNPEIKSIPIPPSDAAALAEKISSERLTEGFRPSAGSAPGTFAELKNLRPPEPKPASALERLQAEMNREPVPTATEPIKSISVDDIRAARSALNQRAKERALQGEPTPDAEAARRSIGEIDKFLDTIDPRLRAANANYSAGKMADTLEYRNIKAAHRAAKTGSGSNIENTMRQEMDKIKDRGLRPAEIAARDQITEGTFARNALRKIGKLGFGDGLSTMYHAAAAIPTGGSSLAVGTAATVARKIGEALTRREIRALSDQIRSRSPTAQALLAAPRAPQTVTAQTRAIAAALLGGNRGQMPFAASVMPSHAEQNQ